MREFSRKRQIWKKLYSIPFIIILFIILFFLVKGVWGIFKKSQYSERQKAAVESELVELQQKKQSIEERIHRLQTETGKEEEVRSKFDVAREGEKLIVIVEEEEVIPVIEKDHGLVGKFFTTIGSWFQ